LFDRSFAVTSRQFMPWALIGAACLGSFAATSSGTTRAPFLLEMAHDLHVSMPLVANLVSMTATAWGITSALAGYLSDRFGRRPILIAAPFALAFAMVAQAFASDFFGRCRLGEYRRRLRRDVHGRGLCRSLWPSR
jgi:predicted MFS family arabinose efflux permease